jgi:uncharacterized membrane-anchored protein
VKRVNLIAKFRLKGIKHSTRETLTADLRIKVPEVTALFWVIKVLSTGMGETAADFVDKRFNPIYAVVIAGAILVLALWRQFTGKCYEPVPYWFAVVMVSVFGTMIADAAHVALGIPYAVSTSIFIFVLVVIFIIWYRFEGTLSIHSINTNRREFFYWSTVMTTFALGTAAGDLTAVTLNWGFFWSGILFAIAFAIPGIAYKWFGLPEVAAFWSAYIITRPFGASFADWMGVSKERGGLAWGTGCVTIGLTVIIVALIRRLVIEKNSKEAVSVTF